MVRDDPLDLDAPVGVERGGPRPEGGRGCRLLVVEDLGVGKAGAVVDGAVEVAIAGTAVALGAIPTPSVKAPAAALGDGGQLLDVDEDELARALALVAADGRARPVTAIEPADALGGQDRLHGGESKAICWAMRAAPKRWRARRSSTWARFAGEVAQGHERGLLGWSWSPQEPWARKRSRHLRTVLASTWKRSAVASTVQCRSSTHRTIRARPVGVSTALGCWRVALLMSPPCEL